MIGGLLSPHLMGVPQNMQMGVRAAAYPPAPPPNAMAGGPQAQAPGMGALASFRQFAQNNPDALMALGAGIMQGNTAGGFAAAAPMVAEGRKKNQTLEFLRKNDPELAQMVEGGMPIPDAFGLFVQKRQAQKPSYINAGDGRLFNESTGEWLMAPNSGSPEFRMASPEEAGRYGAAAGQFGPDGRFYPINPPSGMTVESDGQGGIRVVQGPMGQNRPLTEAQSKDAVYATRAEGALTTLDTYDTALASPVERAMERDPTGLIRGRQSPEFQQASQAGNEFLQAILRKDTGAAITAAEMDEYGRTYLPMPGDGPEVLQQKRVARRRALEALKAGMPAQAILNQEQALRNSGSSRMAPVVIDGYEIEQVD